MSYNYAQHGGPVEEVRLIFAGLDVNSYKYWNATLCVDGTIIVHNGRVGDSGQIRPVSATGVSGLRKLEKDKLRKGYEHQRTVAGPVPVVTPNASIAEIAKRDLVATDNSVLLSLIEKLVAANVHTITSSTSIVYDASSGVFSTPLGILTEEAIEEARNLLTLIHAGMCSGKIQTEHVEKYLRIVPQKVGRKLDINAIFGTSDKINAQMNILDSLAESIKASRPVATDQLEVETVFKARIEVETDKKERKWIEKFYASTSSNKHACYGMRIHEIFSITLEDCKCAFEEKGRGIGNVQRLWHGTSTANVLSILRSGLRTAPPSTARIAGKAFGNGIYFSDIATKSLNYATGYWGGSGNTRNAFMLLNEVAMGKSYDPSRVDAYGTWPKSGTQSTFARGGGVFANNEMIVYENYQVNPTHLVEFTNTSK